MGVVKRGRRARRRARRGGAWAGLGRLIRYRLIVPLKRSQHPPEHLARGSLVGLAWAFTPTMGVRMSLVVLSWLVARWLAKWDFNVLVALAWTWTTNALVVIPVYYLFYVTGQILLGNWHDVSGYQAFGEALARVFAEDSPGSGWVDWPDAVLAFLDLVLIEGGLCLVIGSLPWAAATGALGYVWTLRFVRAHRAARAERRAQKRLALERTAPDGAKAMAPIPVRSDRRH